VYVLSLGEHPAAASAVVGLWGVGSLLANLPAGVLVSRHGDKFVMLLALVAGLVAGIGIALSRDLLLLAALTFLFGASGGAWMLARLSFMTEAAPPAKRGRAISLLGGVQRLGGFVGPAACGWLATAYGFDVAFLVASAAVLAGLVLVWRYTRGVVPVPADASLVDQVGAVAPAASDGARSPSPVAPHVLPARATPPRPGLASQWFVLRSHRRVFATAGAAVVAIALVRSAYTLLIPLWGTHIGLDAAQVGLLFSVLSGIDMLLFYPVGIVMDRWGRKWVGIPCLLGLAASLALLPLTSSFAALAGVALLCGFANGLGSGIVMTMGSDFAPAARRGEFLGVWRSLADLGTVGAPFITSLLSATSGLAGACVATAAVGLVGAGVMAFAFEEPLRQARDASA
jgi:MFS family permease